MNRLLNLKFTKKGAESLGGSSQYFKKYIQSELDKILQLLMVGLTFNQQKVVKLKYGISQLQWYWVKKLPFVEHFRNANLALEQLQLMHL